MAAKKKASKKRETRDPVPVLVENRPYSRGGRTYRPGRGRASALLLPLTALGSFLGAHPPHGHVLSGQEARDLGLPVPAPEKDAAAPDEPSADS